MLWSIAHPPNKELVAPTARLSVKNLLNEILCSAVGCDKRLWWVVCLQGEKVIVICDVQPQVGNMECGVGF